MGSILTKCVRSVNESVDEAQKQVNGEIDQIQNDVNEWAEDQATSDDE